MVEKSPLGTSPTKAATINDVSDFDLFPVINDGGERLPKRMYNTRRGRKVIAHAMREKLTHLDNLHNVRPQDFLNLRYYRKIKNYGSSYIVGNTVSALRFIHDGFHARRMAEEIMSLHQTVDSPVSNRTRRVLWDTLRVLKTNLISQSLDSRDVIRTRTPLGSFTSKVHRFLRISRTPATGGPGLNSVPFGSTTSFGNSSAI